MGDGDIIGKMLLGDSVRIITFALENKFEYDFQEETEITYLPAYMTLFL